MSELKLIDVAKRYCLQHEYCRECPLREGMCITNKGELLYFDSQTPLKDLVNLAYHLEAFADDLEL